MTKLKQILYGQRHSYKVKHQTARRLIILLLAGLALACALSLAACAALVTTAPETVTAIPLTPTPSPTPTSRAVPTLTRTPSLTPTLIVTPGPSPTPAPTPVFGSARVGDDFLFGNQPAGCELPCWQGLVMGESNAQDVQAMFEMAFGFSGMSDLPPESIFVASDMPGLVRLSHQWVLQDRDGEASGDSFFVASFVEEDTQILEATRLRGHGNQFEPYIAPQRVLRELGIPSHILVSLSPAESTQWGSLDMLVIYDEGIAIYYSVRIVSIVGQNPQAGSGPAAELCLADLPREPFTEVFLTTPFEEEDLGTLLSPLRYMGIDHIKVMPYFAPLEEVFGLSLEEVTELAQQKENACIYAPMP